jgi:membrane carboxypeptidase/penicillin-binding protein
MFIGIPFLTAFSYILLAGEVMELNAEQNIQKLYKVMENNGYDTEPHELTKIFPSDHNSLKRENQKKIEKNDNTT